jgi:hypothetical protein
MFVGRAVNLISSSCDFTHASWSRRDGAMQHPTMPTTLGPDGVSQAQVWVLPDTNGTNPGHLSLIELASDIDLGEPLDGKLVVLRYWFKPIAPGNPTVFNSHRLRSRLQRTPHDSSVLEIDCVIDGSGDWQFVEHRYAVPEAPGNPSTMDLIRFCPNDTSDGIVIAPWGIQLFVLSSDPSGQPAEQQHMPYIPKPAHDMALNLPGHGRLLEGPLVLAYGHNTAREIVAEDSPETLNLAPPAGDTQWRVSDRCWNVVPVAGGPVGWICVQAGMPGVWKAFGMIAPYSQVQSDE